MQFWHLNNAISGITWSLQSAENNLHKSRADKIPPKRYIRNETDVSIFAIFAFTFLFAYNALKWDYAVLSILCSNGEMQTFAHTRSSFYLALRVLYSAVSHAFSVSFFPSFIRTIIALFLSILFICDGINNKSTAIPLVVKRVYFKARCNFVNLQGLLMLLKIYILMYSFK